MTLRLSAPLLDFWVDVRLCAVGGRWVAVAEIAGERELGLGHTAQEALLEALQPLGVCAAKALLRDAVETCHGKLEAGLASDE